MPVKEWPARSDCVGLAIFGLGNDSEIAKHAGLHATRAACTLSSSLRALQCGAAGIQAEEKESDGGGEAIGASVGVDVGWCWAGKLGHAARHTLGLLGGPAEAAEELMGYKEAAGEVLLSPVRSTLHKTAPILAHFFVLDILTIVAMRRT